MQIIDIVLGMTIVIAFAIFVAHLYFPRKNRKGS